MNMRYELFIGLRYLRAKRKEAFISLITVISTFGVLIGVMTLNVVLAVMTGFEEDLRDRILGFNPHVTIEGAGGPLRQPASVAERAREVPGVVDAVPFVSGQALLSAAGGVAGVMVRGITPAVGGVLELERHMPAGALGELATLHPVAPTEGQTDPVELPGLIIGKDVARQLGLRAGDAVTVVSPVARPTAVGMLPRLRRFAVVAAFESGMAEYDSAMVYMDLAAAQRFFQLGDGVSGIALRGADLDRADDVGRRLRAALGADYRISDWKEVNHNLFSALRLEKTVYFIVLLLIVLVAAFNIVATLVMVVMEKRKDVAILKSMGAPRAAIRRIFVYKGTIIGAIGTLGGNLLGFAACWLLQRYQFIPLPRDVFYVNALPVKIYPEHFLIVTAASLLICTVATVYPARQAARLTPVDVIRYD